MDSKKLKKTLAGALPALLIFSNLLFGDILSDVKNLNIGLNNYIIGGKLNNYKQLKKINQSYTGTEKYKDKDLMITVAKNGKIIIGLYKKFDNVSYEKLKDTISFLMMKFGEPTVEAHGKTIYWFYSKKGKITNEEFLKMKEKGIIKKPILMVKFHSNKFISKKEDRSKYSFYFIIYSTPLIKNILNN